ncbi:MAG: DnaA ATPase domain-containing protein [Phycisphaerales bacterium JB064]
MSTAGRDVSVRMEQQASTTERTVRSHQGSGKARAASQPAGDHTPALNLVGSTDTTNAPTRVPTRLPGRDAAGERVRTRHVHPGRNASVQPSAQPMPAAADSQDLDRTLADKVGSLIYERYFKGQTRIEAVEGGLRVVVASSFLVSIFESRFRPVLVELANGGTVEIVDRPEAFPKAKMPKATKVARPKPQEQAPRPHVPQRDRPCLLEDFVVGESNRLAHMAAMTVSNPASASATGNLLVLHGGCGLGKTHLLRGMAHRYNSLRGSGGKAKYVTAEHFTNGFLTALRSGTTDRFREQYRGVELLCLDDVHFLATKEATKAELLHTLDQILSGGCRLALASDEHPKLVEGLGKQLVSRLISGLTIELGMPEAGLRESMVRKLATQRGLGMDDTVVSAVAEAASEPHADGEPGGSFRDIEGAMARVDAFHRLMSREGDKVGSGPVTMLVVQQAFGRKAAAASTAGPVRVQTVIECVCQYLGVGSVDFAGRGRHRKVVLARALVALISRKLTTASYPEIAHAMNRPNHSSIITAVRRIERQIADDERVAVGCEADGMSVAELASALAKRIRPQGR